MTQAQSKMRVMVALILGGAALGFQDPAIETPLQRDYAALKARAEAYSECVTRWREAEASEREALRAEELKEREALQAAYREFLSSHAKEGMGPELAQLFVASVRDPDLNSLFPTWVSWALEHGNATAFLSACKALETAGLDQASRDRLDHPRSIALFAAGEDDAALELASQRAAALGPRGLLLLDVAAAIHASRGELAEAQALYATWIEDYAESQPRYAPQVRTKAARLGQLAPSLGPMQWIGPRGTEHAGFPTGKALQGAVVLLDFWQSWCGPCRAQMHDLSRLQTQLGTQLRVIGLCRDDASPGSDGSAGNDGFDAEQKRVPAATIAGKAYADHVRELVKGLELDYVFAVAPASSKFHEECEIRSYPTLWVMNTEGRVAWIAAGAGPGLPLLLRTLAERLTKRVR